MNSSEHENTVIVPTISYPKVARCVETLIERTPPNFRVIVVSQGPFDLYQKIRDKVHLFIQSYRPLGFAKACNTGWRLADTPYVTICNDDVEFVNKRWWEGVKEEFKDPTVVGVNPKTARAYVSGMTIQSRLPYKEQWNEEDYEQMLRLPYDSLQCQAMFCTTFRQDIAKRIGYFDEFFYPSGGEDIDWIVRAKGFRESTNRFRGYSVVSTPKSYVWHWWNQSAVDPSFVKARIQLRQKWGPNFGLDTATTQKVMPKPIIMKL